MPVAPELAAGVLVRVDEGGPDVDAPPVRYRTPGGDGGPGHRGPRVVVGPVSSTRIRVSRWSQASARHPPRGQLDVEGVPALRGRKLLRPAEDEADGPAGPDGERRREHLLVGDLGLGRTRRRPRPPGPHLPVSAPGPGDLLPHEVRGLGGRPELQPARPRIPAGQGAVGLHAGMGLAAEAVPPADRGAATGGRRSTSRRRARSPARRWPRRPGVESGGPGEPGRPRPW